MALQNAIDLSPVPNRQQMNLILLHVEGVDDAIVANAKTKTIRAL